VSQHEFDLLDSDGYPTEDALGMIENYDVFSHKQEFIDYLESIWTYKHLFNYDGRKLKVSTGGWSGNEDIIEKMRGHTMFWMFAWEESRRGGHYIFDMTRIKER